MQSLALRRHARRLSDRIFRPVSPDDLRFGLEHLGCRTDRLLVHSSLSACGYFRTGPAGVLQVLGGFCDTLVLPTFTYCYPPSSNKAGPLFDARSTPSRTGLLTETFRTQAAVTRSIHATHSVAASGTVASEVCADHFRLDAPCGAGSPFDRLLRHRTGVLLLGVTFHSYTLFHTAEDASGSACAYEAGTRDHLQVVDETGQPRQCWSRRQSRAPRRFAAVGRLLERVGLARRVPLGRGELTFVADSSKVHDFLVDRLRRTPDFLYQSCARPLE